SLSARGQRRGPGFLRGRRACPAPRLALARNTPAGHRPPAAPREATKQAQQVPIGLKAEAGKSARSWATPIGSILEDQLPRGTIGAKPRHFHCRSPLGRDLHSVSLLSLAVAGCPDRGKAVRQPGPDLRC